MDTTAIDVGRNELARLGLHPGARHPNVADSTPVPHEDSTTIFYDYWTFNRPTVIKTSWDRIRSPPRSNRIRSHDK